jgi:Outer membrane protein beta-barrel domain
MRINRRLTNLSTMLFVIFFMILTVCMPTQKAYAQEPTQSEVDESFDPFADYNEYEQQSEEEEDVNFLRNGRYLTIAFLAGYRSFIGGGFTQAYRGNLAYGAELSYFFNLQLAMGLSYTISDHNVGFSSFTNETFTLVRTNYNGSVNMQAIDFHMKYYFNTDNVTKGLADLSPYGVLGTSYNIRAYSLDQTLTSSPDQVWGFKVGAGIEVPILKHKGYMGFQANYRYVQFPDENKGYISEGDGANDDFPVRPKLDGDIYEILALIGLNF